MASCKGSREKRTSPKMCNLCETDWAIYYCQTCLCNICNICIVGHRRQTDMRNHEVIFIGNTFNTVYCLEKYMRPVIQVIEDKCTSLEKKVADVESKNLNLTREKKMIEDKCTSLEKKVADIESKNQNLTGEKKMIEDKCISLEKKVADIEANNQDLTGEKKGAKPQPPFPPQGPKPQHPGPPQGPKPQHPGPPQEELQRKIAKEMTSEELQKDVYQRMLKEYEKRKKKKETHRWFGASAGCSVEMQTTTGNPPPFWGMTTKELKKRIEQYRVALKKQIKESGTMRNPLAKPQPPFPPQLAKPPPPFPPQGPKPQHPGPPQEAYDLRPYTVMSSTRPPPPDKTKNSYMP